LCFELDGRAVAERLVQAGVVKPADPLDDRELELRAGAPDAVGDQLGLEGVHEGLSQRVS
jgi:endonuclease YncB( thermonuclease family)